MSLSTAAPGGVIHVDPERYVEKYFQAKRGDENAAMSLWRMGCAAEPAPYVEEFDERDPVDFADAYFAAKRGARR